MARKTVNNAFYDELHEGWYASTDHPIALLRAENRARAPWVAERMTHFLPQKPCRVLDIGCGAGFLTNHLAKLGHQVTGIDLSQTSLDIARKNDSTQQVIYETKDAYALTYEASSFDVIAALDFLEHIEDPAPILQNVGRMLKKEGLFFFHTFNRTLLSYLVVIKGVDWFVKNAPAHMHLYRLFLRPAELTELLKLQGLEVVSLQGFSPKIDRHFWKMVLTGKVGESFSFQFTSSLAMGYVGIARKI